jgi:hypothetical protein
MSAALPCFGMLPTFLGLSSPGLAQILCALPLPNFTAARKFVRRHRHTVWLPDKLLC